MVIYEENHSFDNLYGTWGTRGRRPRGRPAQSRRAQRTQVAQDGTPYRCLLQEDVNLTSPAARRPVRGRRRTGCRASHFTNRPFAIDDYIRPDGQDLPAARRLRRPTAC